MGAGYWAYQNGHLDGLIEQIKPLVAGIMPNGAGVAEQAAPATPAPIFAPAVASVVDQGQLTKSEIVLQRNMADVQPWARANLDWVAAMMWAESDGNTNAVSHRGARGVLQVMPGTQDDLYRWGWKKYPPDHNMLHSENIGVYYGTAYMEHLSKTSSDREWITRAYNAGPGGKRNGIWPPETNLYYPKIKKKYQEIISRKQVA